MDLRGDNMKMYNNDLNLEFTRGDTFTFGIVLYELGQNLDGAKFTCKQNVDDETPVFQKTLGSGVTLEKVDMDDYTYKIRVAPADTEDLEAGKYFYDFQIEVGQDVFTILKGVLTLEADVSERGQ